MSKITLKEKRDEIRRELAMRRRAYPRWVEARRMTQRDADRQIALMEAILADYDTPPASGDLFEGGGCGAGKKGEAND